MNNDATSPPSSAASGYISFVAHIWVGDNGKLIRGTIEDVHTGTRLALDLSEFVAFLQTSLAHSPGQARDLQNEGDEDMNASVLSPERISPTPEDLSETSGELNGETPGHGASSPEDE